MGNDDFVVAVGAVVADFVAELLAVLIEKPNHAAFSLQHEPRARYARNCVVVEVVHSLTFVSGRGQRWPAAKTAAPRSPASALRMIFTGIFATRSSSGGFARNARMNVPEVIAGRIFGAIPPPTNTPPVDTVRSARLPASA